MNDPITATFFLIYTSMILTLTTRQACADKTSKISAKCLSNFNKIVDFHDHIWNHREECIQMSTNMPSIGLVIHEIEFEI